MICFLPREAAMLGFGNRNSVCVCVPMSHAAL